MTKQQWDKACAQAYAYALKNYPDNALEVYTIWAENVLGDDFDPDEFNELAGR